MPDIVSMLTADSPGLMYALLHFGSQHPNQLAPFKQDLLVFFCDSVLGAKQPVSAEKLSAYSPLAAQLSQAEFSSTILPAILKYVRRTPDAALVSIKALLNAVQLDLSSSAHDLIDQLLKLARGSKESVRCGKSLLSGPVRILCRMAFKRSLSCCLLLHSIQCQGV